MRTIRHYVDRRASEHPDKVFMIAPEPGLTLTYGQLKDWETSQNWGASQISRMRSGP